MDFSDMKEEMEIPLKRERLCTRFGPASQILGMGMKRDRKSGTLALSQRGFACWLARAINEKFLRVSKLAL